MDVMVRATEPAGTGSSPAAEDLTRRIEEIARRALAALGLDFVHLVHRREGGRWVVRLFVESPRGVSLEDCARASHQVGVTLDAEDVPPYPYVLEVSSPGLDRPLFSEADYVRFAGSKAHVTTREPVNGRRRFAGILAGCEAGVVTMHLSGGGDVALPFSAIASGRLEVDLQPGQGTRPRRPRT
jgi:ribosome maturation factor RimP